MEVEVVVVVDVVEIGKDILVNVYNKKFEFKILNFLIKVDVSGIVEVVVSFLEYIGNKEVGVKIIYIGVGEILELDVLLVEVFGGEIFF